MNLFTPMLAQGDLSTSEAFGAWSSMSEEARTRLVMFSAYALVIGALVAWALFIRKQKAERRRIYKKHPHTWQQTEAGGKHRGRHRQRRRRSSGPLQNPSLAESGGLPPRRPDDVPPAGT